MANQSSIEKLYEAECLTNSLPTTLRGDAADQPPIEQSCEVERPTNSLPIILQGRAAVQPSTEQPCEAERPTNSLSINLAMQSGQPSPQRATQRGGTLDPVLLTHVSHQRTCCHQTTFGPITWHTEGVLRSPNQRDKAPLHTIFS